MPFNVINNPEVFERVRRLQIPFNRYGLDRYGISQEHLANVFTVFRPFYERYFSVECYGLEHVPGQGRGMLVGNHSGGIPVDGAMLLSALFFDKEPPRLVHGMVDKFANRWPIVSQWFSRMGQFTGLPEHAVRLLKDDRLLMVFPEGAEGTAKLFKDRYKLLDFGTGFMRLALKSDSPIIPFAFIGGEEAMPVMFRLEKLGNLLGAPYVPVPPHLLPIPLPVHCEFHFGEPMNFEGDGTESDETIQEYIDQVRTRIEALIEKGRRHWRKRIGRGDRERAIEGSTNDTAEEDE